MMDLAIFGTWVVCFGGSCAIIASSRNRSAGGWFALGALFGIFALVVICALPALAYRPWTPKAHKRETDAKAWDEFTKRASGSRVPW